MFKIKDAAVIFIAVTHHTHVQLSRTLSCSSLVSTHMLQACNEFLKRCVLCRTCQGMFGGGRAEREREKEWEWYCGREWVVSAAPTATFPPPTDQLSVRRSVSPSPCLSVCPSVSLSVSGCLEQCEIKNCNKLQAKRQINYKIEERERQRERKRRRKGTTSECKKLAYNGDVMPPLPTDEKEFSVRI